MTTTTTEHLEELAAIWRHFADHEAGTYSPLYASITRSVAADAELLALVLDAPPHAHYPLSLLAAAHDIVLRGIDHPLDAVYRGEGGDPGAAFRDLCLAHREDVLALMAARRIQTNECGRSALIALGLAEVEARAGEVAAVVDAGTSAGLNLLFDRYHLDYGALGSRGDVSSGVHIPCEVRGRATLPPALPTVPVRVGLDREPIDATDPDAARWLLACTWPDTGRLERTAAALAIAAQDPPVIRQGDVVDDLAGAIEATGVDGLVCVVSSWVLGYLRGRDRGRFVDVLRDVSSRRPVAWLSFEGPGVVNLFDVPEVGGTWTNQPSVVGLTTFAGGSATSAAIARVHPHGSVIAWT